MTSVAFSNTAILKFRPLLSSLPSSESDEKWANKDCITTSLSTFLYQSSHWHSIELFHFNYLVSIVESHNWKTKPLKMHFFFILAFLLSPQAYSFATLPSQKNLSKLSSSRRMMVSGGDIAVVGCGVLGTSLCKQLLSSPSFEGRSGMWYILCATYVWHVIRKELLLMYYFLKCKSLCFFFLSILSDTLHLSSHVLSFWMK